MKLKFLFTSLCLLHWKHDILISLSSLCALYFTVLLSLEMPVHVSWNKVCKVKFMSGTCLCLCLVHAPVGQSWPGLRKTGGRGWEETVGEQLRGWRRKSKELGMSGWGKRTAGMEMREAGKECRNEAGLTSANIKARVSDPDKPCGRKRLCLCFYGKKKRRGRWWIGWWGWHVSSFV